MNHIDALADECARFVAAIERGDPGAAVPSCPDWTLSELVQHCGGVQRWATRIVVERRESPVEEDLETNAGGWPEDTDLAPWFRAGHTLLVDALRAAPDDLQCWTFMKAPSPLAFWARRQLHETTIHRVDAELASGAVTSIATEVAVDGIDELLTGFLPRRSSNLKPDTPLVMAIKPNDHDAVWTVTANAEGATTERSLGEPTIALRASAEDLYRFLWNRASSDVLHIEGDPALLDQWRSSDQVRWS